MRAFLKTAKGKITVLLIFYIPFACAVFFNFFDGQGFTSPIGECCIPMEGVVIAGYGLLSVWVLVPLTTLYLGYKGYRKYHLK